MPRRERERVTNAATGKSRIQNSTRIRKPVKKPTRDTGPRNMQDVFAKLERALTSNRRRAS